MNVTAIYAAPSGPTKLAYTTPAFTGTVGQCLGPVGIQTQNASNTATNVTSNTLVSLATDGAGQFYASGDATCSGSVITGVTITSGTNAASFRYKATARGTGSHSLTASAASLTPASQTQTIAKTNQTITFGALANKAYGNPDFTVSATASSGLAVTFAASGNCTVTGNSVHITAAQLRARLPHPQPGDANFNAASSVSQPFNIAKADATITVSGYTGVYDGGRARRDRPATGIGGAA